MDKEKYSWEQDLIDQIGRFALIHCLSISELLSFLSLTLSGTMAKHGFSENFAKLTFDKMLVHFQEKKKEFNK